MRAIEAQQNRINRLMFREAERVAKGAGCASLVVFGDTNTTLAGALAGCTTRIGIGTLVANAANRTPGMTVTAAASVQEITQATVDSNPTLSALGLGSLVGRFDTILADITTVIPVRKKPTAARDAFQAASSTDATIDVPMVMEDLASVLVRFENGAKGAFSVGQVNAGHKNDLVLEICGSAASMTWRQEAQNELWIGHRDRASERLQKDPSLMNAAGRAYAHLPGGHQESWADAFSNLMRDIVSRWRQAASVSRATLGVGATVVIAIAAIPLLLLAQFAQDANDERRVDARIGRARIFVIGGGQLAEDHADRAREDDGDEDRQCVHGADASARPVGFR